MATMPVNDGDAERGYRNSAAVYPIERDSLADTEVLICSPNNGRRKPQPQLIVEFDGGNGVRRCVIDPCSRWSLMQEDQKKDGAVAAHWHGLYIARPALGADWARGMMHVSALPTYMDPQLMIEPPAVVRGAVTGNRLTSKPFHEFII